MIRITKDLSISPDELSFSFSHSSKPGGQNVNKSSTRVTLAFDVANSPSLDERRRRLVLERLATRINKQGILRVVSQRHRTQRANRMAAIDRFVELVAGAVTVRKTRRRTRVPQGVVEARLRAKRRRGRLKRERSGMEEGAE